MNPGNESQAPTLRGSGENTPQPYKGAAVLVRDRSHRGRDGSIEHAAIITAIKPNGLLSLTAFPAGTAPYTLDDVHKGMGETNAGEECWFWPHDRYTGQGMQDAAAGQARENI